MRLPLYRTLLDEAATLLRGGIPVLEAFETIGRSPQPAIAAAARALLAAIRGGSTVGEAMARRPDDFPPAHAALVAASEKAGALPAAFTRLVEEVDRRLQIQRTLAMRSTYPLAVLALAAILTPLFLIFQGRTGSYVALEIAVFAVAGGAILLARFLWVRWSDAIEELPFVGGVLRRARIGQSLSLLGLLVEAGIGLREALALAAGAARSEHLSLAFRQAARELEAGKDLSGGLLHVEGIPAHLRGKISTGEKAGAMDRALKESGRELEDGAARALERMAILLPILLYLIAGAVVGGIYINTVLEYLSGAGLSG